MFNRGLALKHITQEDIPVPTRRSNGHFITGAFQPSTAAMLLSIAIRWLHPLVFGPAGFYTGKTSLN
jgi:hypothetical protein